VQDVIKQRKTKLDTDGVEEKVKSVDILSWQYKEGAKTPAAGQRYLCESSVAIQRRTSVEQFRQCGYSIAILLCCIASL